MRSAEKEIKEFSTRIPLVLYSREQILKKKIAKKFKKLENNFSALFLANSGWDRPRMREKNFKPQFRSNSTRGRKFRKKNSKTIQKIKKQHFIVIFSQNGAR